MAKAKLNELEKITLTLEGSVRHNGDDLTVRPVGVMPSCEVLRQVQILAAVQAWAGQTLVGIINRVGREFGDTAAGRLQMQAVAVVKKLRLEGEELAFDGVPAERAGAVDPRLERVRQAAEGVGELIVLLESRAAAVDGPVAKTLAMASDAELEQLFEHARTIAMFLEPPPETPPCPTT